MLITNSQISGGKIIINISSRWLLLHIHVYVDKHSCSHMYFVLLLHCCVASYWSHKFPLSDRSLNWLGTINLVINVYCVLQGERLLSTNQTILDIASLWIARSLHIAKSPHAGLRPQRLYSSKITHTTRYLVQNAADCWWRYLRKLDTKHSEVSSFLWYQHQGT